MVLTSLYVHTYVRTYVFVYFLSIIGISKENKVFNKFYSDLVKVLPIKNIKYRLVPPRILTHDDIEEITCLKESTKQSSYVLEIIAKSLDANITTSFYALLKIMEEYGGDVSVLGKNIQKALAINLGKLMHMHICTVAVFI